MDCVHSLGAQPRPAGGEGTLYPVPNAANLAGTANDHAGGMPIYTSRLASYLASPNWFAPTLSHTIPAAATNITATASILPGWQYVSVDFLYCGSAPSNTLYLDLGTNTTGTSYTGFYFDNLSIKEDFSTNFTFLSQVLATPPCTAQLQAMTPPALSCGGPAYTWKDAGGAVIGTGNTVTVPYQTANYTLTVSNGCTTQVLNVPVVNPFYTPGITVSPSASICVGDPPISLTANSTGVQ